MRKKAWLAAAGIAMGTWLALYSRVAPKRPDAAPHPVAIPSASGFKSGAEAREARMDPSDDSHDDERSYVFRIPSGEPTSLSCEEARTIIDQVRAGLAYAPESVQAAQFATSTSDWLDPHGLLSLAKDAPTSRAVARAAPGLIADIENRRQRACESALAPGAILEQWSNELREAFDRGRRAPGGMDPKVATLELLPPTGMARAPR